MRIGCHLSIRNGYLAAAKTAHALGAAAFQFFPKNPRGLTVKDFDRRDAEACAVYCREHRLHSIAHTPYPTNLAADSPETFQLTVASVKNDLAIADACGALGVVVHFGQYKGSVRNPLHGYQVMIRMLNEILVDWQGGAMLLIENNAGQGSRMGTTLEELVQIRALAERPEMIGFCLDTCHLFASGVWDGRNWPEVAKRARGLGYFQHLRAIHLNDSVYPTRSFRDRHANIGRGEIGEAALMELLRTEEIRGLPIVLETPRPAGGSHSTEIRHVQEMGETLASAGKTW